MTAALWLILSVFAGWQIIGFPGNTGEWVASMGSPATATRFCRAPWTLWMLRLAMAVSVGLLTITWLTYGLAACLHVWLPAWHPLLPANLIIMSGLAAWACMIAYRKRQSLLAGWPGRVRALQQGTAGMALLTGLFWLLFAGWLMFSTFYRSNSYIHAGYSVFSDFAPHTAMVSSFSQGRNWPTQYPHFANDGIAYHFMFFFLCGNLNYLGLSLDWAINLPSMLTFFSFCILLGFLAVRLTGRTAAFLLVPLMFFLRSSAAFFTNLAELMDIFGSGPRAWGTLLRLLWQQASFIGSTPRDDWGLWGINVYANQRHLLSGLSLMLVVLLLVLPDLQTGLRFGRQSWIRLDGWLPLRKPARKRYAVACFICLLMPYWHGSALVSLLLILIPVALFSVSRLGMLLLAIGSFGAAMLQSWLFSGQATRVVQPAFFYGFIATDRSAGGILHYLFLVTGLVLPLLLIAFWLPGWRRKVLLTAFMMPLVFAFTISLTPDVTVNHKFIIIFLALANIYLADLLIRLWQKDGRPAGHSQVHPAARPGPLPVMLRPRRLAALLLAGMLMITGLHEIRIMRNINQNTVTLDSQSPFVTWIRENTQPAAVFVSAPYHYHTFFLSGRAIWFGHSYYAWSAGHDTSMRFAQLRLFLTGYEGDLDAVRHMVREENLHYLLLDDTLRNNNDLPVNESFFSTCFQLVASFPEQGNMLIYDLRQTP